MNIQRMKELKLWTRKPVIVTTIIVGILLLFLLGNILWPNDIYEYQGNMTLGAESSGQTVVAYEGIHLSPGVYRVELEYQLDKDLGAMCNVQDSTVFTGGLLCNGEHMYRALERTEFHMWLYESTDALQVAVMPSNGAQLEVGNLTIYETNQLWTMLLTVLLAMAVVVYGALIYYYYDLKYPVEKGKKQVFFWLVLIILVASLPYLYGSVLTGADLTYHLQRIEGVKDGLRTGQFPVRLQPEWVYGHGYADAIFYCNALLYFPAILRLLGFTVTASYNIYCIGLNIATAWIAYYCFARIFRNRNIGVACSALYTLSIFRIYKLVVTTAVGEGSAATFIPLVLYGLYRVFAEDPKEKRYKTAWIPIVIGYAGLIQTHVLTCEITALVTIVICVIHIRKILNLNTFLELAKGATGALLVSLWFLVPFLDYFTTQDVHIRFVSARTIQSQGLNPAHLLYHFWTVGQNTPTGANGIQYSHPVGLGLVLAVGLVVFLLLWFSGVIRKEEGLQVAFVKRTSLLGGALLVMSLNLFPWDQIQSLHPIAASLVSSLQFPNRFLGWGSTCLILVMGYCLWYFNRKYKWAYGLLVGAVIFGVTTSGMYMLDYVKQNQDRFVLYNEESMGFGYISGAEYLIEGTKIGDLSFAKPVAYTGVELQSYEGGDLRYRLDCVNTSDAWSAVDVPLLMYKGYQAVCTDAGEPLKLCYGENNVVRVLLPGGFAGSIEVRFVSPVYWRISEVISVAAIGVVLFCIMKNRRKKDEGEI